MERVKVKYVKGASAGQEKVSLKEVAEAYEARGLVKILGPAGAAPKPEKSKDEKSKDK